MTRSPVSQNWRSLFRAVRLGQAVRRFVESPPGTQATQALYEGLNLSPTSQDGNFDTAVERLPVCDYVKQTVVAFRDAIRDESPKILSGDTSGMLDASVRLGDAASNCHDALRGNAAELSPVACGFLAGVSTRRAKVLWQFAVAKQAALYERFTDDPSHSFAWCVALLRGVSQADELARHEPRWHAYLAAKHAVLVQAESADISSPTALRRLCLDLLSAIEPLAPVDGAIEPGRGSWPQEATDELSQIYNDLVGRPPRVDFGQVAEAVVDLLIHEIPGAGRPNSLPGGAKSHDECMFVLRDVVNWLEQQVRHTSPEKVSRKEAVTIESHFEDAKCEVPDCLGPFRHFPGWAIDNGQFSFRGKTWELAGIRLALLDIFLRNARGRRIDYSMLREAWNDDGIVENETIRNHLKLLRSALRTVCNDLAINTHDPLPHVRSVGWVLNMPGA